MSTSSKLDSFHSQLDKKPTKRPYLSKKYPRFNFCFLLAALLPMLAVGLFNALIDPYATFDTPNFFGINHSKPDEDNNDRLYKALDIIRIRPVTVFIGSSRAKQALDPSHPALANNQPAYNLALNGPNVYEIRRYLEHAIANEKDLKEVIFGVDFFMFNANLLNQPSFSETRLEKKHITVPDAINATFSLDTLFASKETITASINEPNKDDTYGDNGFMPNRRLDTGETEWRFNSGIKLYFELHSNYQFSDQYLSEFRKIVDLCKQNGIILKIFISPAHATDLEAIRVTGRWQDFEQWKRKIVNIAPVWDFSGYNSVTTEPISNYMKNYADNSHYSKPIGDLILDRILSYQNQKVPSDFGILITPENVEAHIAQIRADREVWAKKHPDEIKLVEDIKKSMKWQDHQLKK